MANYSAPTQSQILIDEGLGYVILPKGTSGPSGWIQTALHDPSTGDQYTLFTKQQVINNGKPGSLFYGILSALGAAGLALGVGEIEGAGVGAGAAAGAEGGAEAAGGSAAGQGAAAGAGTSVAKGLLSDAGKITTAAGLISLITSLSFWERVGEAILGAVLLILGLRALTGSSSDPVTVVTRAARRVTP